ncbi:S-layer homology domain-containing protein [Desulforamulus reducens]|nr:S-layer homology domain-containing protein [Desulforamulus reducens]
MRTFLFLLLCLLQPVTVWALGVQSSTVDLKDINNYWAKQPIEKITAIGLMIPFEDNTFRPNQPVSCMESITSIMDGAGYAAQIKKMKSLKNRPATAYVAPINQKYVDFAVQQNYLPGSMLKNFRYDRPISRGELAVLLAKALYLKAPAEDTIFKDNDSIPKDYLPAVQAVHELKVMSGFPDGTFRANGSVTRGQLAAILSKLYDQGWIYLDAKKKVSGWIAGTTEGKNGIDVQVSSLKGIQKVVANASCKAYWQGRPMNLNQCINYRIEGILDSKRRLAYVELVDRRNFSPVQREVYASYLRHAEGEPFILTVKDLMNEEVDYPIAWDAETSDEKSKSKTNKDLLKKLKSGQFLKLGLTSGGTVKALTILDVKNISGEIDRINRALYLEEKGKGSSKKYVPDHFYGWDAGRIVDKEGDDTSDPDEKDKVKIFYIGEPFYERVLEIQVLERVD